MSRRTKLKEKNTREAKGKNRTEHRYIQKEYATEIENKIRTQKDYMEMEQNWSKAAKPLTVMSVQQSRRWN